MQAAVARTPTVGAVRVVVLSLSFPASTRLSALAMSPVLDESWSLLACLLDQLFGICKACRTLAPACEGHRSLGTRGWQLPIVASFRSHAGKVDRPAGMGSRVMRLRPRADLPHALDRVRLCGGGRNARCMLSRLPRALSQPRYEQSAAFLPRLAAQRTALGDPCHCSRASAVFFLRIVAGSAPPEASLCSGLPRVGACVL